MSEWKEKTLGELSIRVSSGLTPLKSNKKFWENPSIPWLKTDQLGEKYIFDTNTKISKEALEQTSLRIYPENTISIAMYGEGKTRGNLSIIKAPMTTNQACCNIEIDPKLADVEYVYYYLKTQYDALRKLSSGVRKNLNSNDIKNYKIYIPESVRFQRSIVKILTSLDNKISVNNQINQELEAMAKTLYDYWFVQFDFPDQNGKPYKSSGGKMVYHPELKREIPEGWGVETLKDFESKIITGKTPSRANSDNFGGEIPFITIGDIRGNTFIYSTSETLTDLGASVQQNKYLPEGSLCVSCIATVGEIGFTTEWSYTNQQINSIVFEDETNRYYLYFALKNYFENANAIAKTGNTFANMNKEDFSGIRIILPRNEIKNNFHKMTEPYFAQIKCLQGQNKELTQLRDWLLPMLMNGQVKII